MYETKTDTAAVAWSPTGWTGVAVKMLAVNEATGGMTGMIKMAAGSSIPAHKHTKADQAMYVLEGDLVEEGVTYGPGSFLVAKTGVPHGPHTSASGCVILSTYFGTPDLVAVE